MSFFDESSDSDHGNNHDNKDEDAEDTSRTSSDKDKDNDYYNFLHVSRLASQEEITAAYKKLSRLYHPDKHRDEERKKQAETMFSKLQKAYEVLNDPHKRAIYDCLGKKGLEEQGWAVVSRTKTPGEIREEYERLAK
jgi:DnaJ family protein C protein 11